MRQSILIFFTYPVKKHKFNNVKLNISLNQYSEPFHSVLLYFLYTSPLIKNNKNYIFKFSDINIKTE